MPRCAQPSAAPGGRGPPPPARGTAGDRQRWPCLSSRPARSSTCGQPPEEDASASHPAHREVPWEATGTKAAAAPLRCPQLLAQAPPPDRTPSRHLPAPLNQSALQHALPPPWTDACAPQNPHVGALPPVRWCFGARPWGHRSSEHQKLTLSRPGGRKAQTRGRAGWPRPPACRRSSPRVLTQPSVRPSASSSPLTSEWIRAHTRDLTYSSSSLRKPVSNATTPRGPGDALAPTTDGLEQQPNRIPNIP